MTSQLCTICDECSGSASRSPGPCAATAPEAKRRSLRALGSPKEKTSTVSPNAASSLCHGIPAGSGHFSASSVRQIVLFLFLTVVSTVLVDDALREPLRFRLRVQQLG